MRAGTGRAVTVAHVLSYVASQVLTGARVEFRPKGSSMRAHISSGALVEVAPVDAAKLDVGDIVLARVAGRMYLHLVSAVDAPHRRVQIANAAGHVNGWTNLGKVAGICVRVDGKARRGAESKVR